MSQKRYYVQIDVKCIRDHGKVERRVPHNLPEKEDTMVNPFHITLFSKPSAIKEKKITFVKIVIKIILFVHTDN